MIAITEFGDKNVVIGYNSIVKKKIYIYSECYCNSSAFILLRKDPDHPYSDSEEIKGEVSYSIYDIVAAA